MTETSTLFSKSMKNHHSWAKITNLSSPGAKPFKNYHWDFDKHCTKEVPEILTKQDLGYNSDEELANGNLADHELRRLVSFYTSVKNNDFRGGFKLRNFLLDFDLPPKFLLLGI